ncbi:MAG: hypothetical protein ACTTKK_07675 [Ottowia sp.]
MSARILALCDALGHLVKSALMPGQRHDNKGPIDVSLFSLMSVCAAGLTSIENFFGKFKEFCHAQ